MSYVRPILEEYKRSDRFGQTLNNCSNIGIRSTAFPLDVEVFKVCVGEKASKSICARLEQALTVV